jgi:hypothetical protein
MTSDTVKNIKLPISYLLILMSAGVLLYPDNARAYSLVGR